MIFAGLQSAIPEALPLVTGRGTDERLIQTQAQSVEGAEKALPVDHFDSWGHEVWRAGHGDGTGAGRFRLAAAHALCTSISVTDRREPIPEMPAELKQVIEEMK